MILTTTNTIDDYKIGAYQGIVTATVVKEQKMTMTFDMEKYYNGISERIAEVKENALELLEKKAENLGADAVVGVKIETELNASYVTVSAVGTAVSLLKR